MARALTTFFVLACCAVSVQSSRINAGEMLSPLAEDEIENTKAVTDEASTETHMCGHPIDTFHLCYPRKKSKIPMIRKAKDACSVPCTGVESVSSKIMGAVVEGMAEGFNCKCPKKGESCRSAGDKDPGMVYTRNGMVSSWTAVKVEVGSGKWQFLTSEEKWDENSKVVTWKWVSPEPTDTMSWSPVYKEDEDGYMFHSHSHKKGDPMVSTPSKSDLEKALGKEHVPDDPDFCDPALAGKYFEAVKANPSRL